MRKFFILFLCLTSSGVFGQSQTNERAKWFTDARYGMFIHWGVYSGAEGYWKGEKLRNDNDYAEWLFYRNQIGREEYLTLLERFDWDAIDPEQWVILAKKAGMKYVTLTAKHHDGFALWDSKVGNYDVGDYTAHRRDIVKELAAACKKHGLRMGLYYSHWVDWEHRFGWNHERELSGIAPKDYDKYWQEKVIPQIRELLTNYGEVSMLWFDMWIHHSQTVVTKAQLLQLKSLIRSLQPDCLVNSRLGLSIEEDPDIDFKTLGDNQLGSHKEEFPWQSPGTVAHSWGFHSGESSWKATSVLLKSLIGNVSLNGNFMLNIGPRANGEVPYEIEHRLLEIGQWLDVNGDAIYGAAAFDLDKNLHDWGKITMKQADGTTRLFLHLYNWPLNRQLPLTGITTPPTRVYLLADKQKQPLEFTHGGAFTNIRLPAMAPSHYVSVIAVEYEQIPETVQNIVAKTTDGGYSMTYDKTVGERTLKQNGRNREGTVPPHVSIKSPQTLKWRLYVDAPGNKNIDVSYSFAGDKAVGKITCRTVNTTLSHTIEPSGQTVGEPNQNWAIPRFLSHRMGKIRFPDAGYYDVELEIAPVDNSELLFQWLWLGQ
ncbi:MAG: alpha-L-fucosidase [Bacteroidales bacterium]|jgi:alpha-L-fucosidase|nr:alpha-L-fucosidase [Bacteroidales bacterium]